MTKNIIFYFSGTRNSLKVAKDIASVLGNTELVFMKGDVVTYKEVTYQIQQLNQS